MSNSEHGVRTIPKVGLEIDLSIFEQIRLKRSGQPLWEANENRDNLLFAENSRVGKHLARFDRIEDSKFAFFERRWGNEEYASRSKPIDLERGISENLKEDLLQGWEELNALAEQSDTTPEAKDFIDSLRLADPRKAPELYRVYQRNGREQLLIIWGCVLKDTFPLMPLEAIQALKSRRRAPILELLARPTVWAPLVLLPLLVALLATVLSSTKGCGDSSPQWIAQVEPRVSVLGNNQVRFTVGCNCLARVTASDGGILYTAEVGSQPDVFRTPLRVGYGKLEVMSNETVRKSFDFAVYREPVVNGMTVELPFDSTQYPDGFRVQWGDGTEDRLGWSTESTDQDPSKRTDIFFHQYTTPQAYTLSIIPPTGMEWARKDFVVPVKAEPTL